MLPPLQPFQRIKVKAVATRRGLERDEAESGTDGRLVLKCRLRVLGERSVARSIGALRLPRRGGDASC